MVRFVYDLYYLQVATFGTAALAISVPFSCILGLFATLTSQTIGKNRIYICKKDMLKQGL